MKIILLLAGLAATTAAAEIPAAEAAALEKRFFDAQRGTRTLTADFTQTVEAPGLPAPVVSRGRLTFRAPDDLRIDYTEPAGDLLQLDAAALTTRRSGQDFVRRAPDHRSARALAALREMLRGRSPPGEWHATVTRRGRDYLVVLTPHTTGSFQPQRIENIIDATTLQLRSLTLHLPRGTIMRFDFSRPRRNGPLPDRAFALP